MNQKWPGQTRSPSKGGRSKVESSPTLPRKQRQGWPHRLPTSPSKRPPVQVQPPRVPYLFSRCWRRRSISRSRTASRSCGTPRRWYCTPVSLRLEVCLLPGPRETPCVPPNRRLALRRGYERTHRRAKNRRRDPSVRNLCPDKVSSDREETHGRQRSVRASRNRWWEHVFPGSRRTWPRQLGRMANRRGRRETESSSRRHVL